MLLNIPQMHRTALTIIWPKILIVEVEKYCSKSNQTLPIEQSSTVGQQGYNVAIFIL